MTETFKLILKNLAARKRRKKYIPEDNSGTGVGNCLERRAELQVKQDNRPWSSDEFTTPELAPPSLNYQTTPA
ncbi:hypothetical protein TNCV_2527761 [Trichonephila clavipes]|nr:hypothetical protein TNCV_2527761 [Trichonephila clavipes]